MYHVKRLHAGAAFFSLMELVLPAGVPHDFILKGEYYVYSRKNVGAV